MESAGGTGRRRRWAFRALTLVVVLAGGLAALEIVLRVTGFGYELRVTVLESTAPDLERARDAYRIDRDLIWVPRDYEEKLEELRRAQIVFLGDSCTEYGRYPRALARLIERRRGRAPAIANLAVAGWTSHQGLRQIERDLQRSSPRVVTIYYGWNDHWTSIGLADDEIERLNRSPLFGLQSTRTGQLILRGWVGFRTRDASTRARVPVESFRDNLTRAARAIRELGAVPVLVTAPSSHEPGNEPAYLAERWMPDLRLLVPTHRKYAEVVREVARAEEVPLADLARDFDGLPRARRIAAFTGDGIHFTSEGDMQAAVMLYRVFERHGLLELVAY